MQDDVVLQKAMSLPSYLNHFLEAWLQSKKITHNNVSVKHMLIKTTNPVFIQALGHFAYFSGYNI